MVTATANSCAHVCAEQLVRVYLGLTGTSIDVISGLSMQSVFRIQLPNNVDLAGFLNCSRCDNFLHKPR
jgi:hypothetical protein